MPLSPDVRPAGLSGPRPLIALVVDRIDWHARELAKAFADRGAASVPVRLQRCEFTTQSAFGLRIDGLADRLPDAVLVRSMSGGTFETVTLRLGFLHALRELGVPVWNDARSIERCVDKSATSFLLARAGIATPPTWTVEAHETAVDIVRREMPSGPLVLKPLFGSQGRGLRLVRSEHDLPESQVVAGVFYLQRFVGVEREGFRDFRLLVSRGRVIAAMVRHASGWITNVKQGGKPLAAVVDGEATDLALRASAAVGANFAGVDLAYGADGRPTVLEVNSMPAWSGLQKVTPTNIAATLACDLLASLETAARQGAGM